MGLVVQDYNMYDFLIVGSGFFGSICAYELNKKGHKVCVIDKRDHIGGNCYTSNRDGINVHEYGPHIFHTSNEKVWGWINQFTLFNDFTYRPVANYKGETYSLPFNMWTFSKIYNLTHPHELLKLLRKHNNSNPKNLEEYAISLVGKKCYKKLIKGYTEKQWMKSAKQLPKEIIERLPVRLTYDNNYFNDKYQGIPVEGYTKIFEKLLDGIDVKLSTDFFTDELPKHKNVIYTGPIDKYFNYQYGHLEYKTVRFEHSKLDMKNYQGTAVMNYTEKKVPKTRTIEHKHFENSNSEFTWVSDEFPTEYKPEITDPYYPVNDETNNNIYEQYKKLSIKEKNVYFGGRLAEYKYYDMDKVILSALNFVEQF